MSAGFSETADGFVLRIRLTPNASRDAVEGIGNTADGRSHIAVRVRAVPEDGKANAALIRVLAAWLGVARRELDVIRGATSRLKTVAVRAEAGERRRLEALMRRLADAGRTD